MKYQRSNVIDAKWGVKEGRKSSRAINEPTELIAARLHKLHLEHDGVLSILLETINQAGKPACRPAERANFSGGTKCTPDKNNRVGNAGISCHDTSVC